MCNHAQTCNSLLSPPYVCSLYLFFQEGFHTNKSLLILTGEDLNELGFTLFTRKKMLQGIARHLASLAEGAKKFSGMRGTEELVETLISWEIDEAHSKECAITLKHVTHCCPHLMFAHCTCSSRRDSTQTSRCSFSLVKI